MKNTKELVRCHCGTNNRAPRWTFMDPCKSEVRAGVREESLYYVCIAAVNQTEGMQWESQFYITLPMFLCPILSGVGNLQWCWIESSKHSNTRKHQSVKYTPQNYFFWRNYFTSALADWHVLHRNRIYRKANKILMSNSHFYRLIFCEVKIGWRRLI